MERMLSDDLTEFVRCPIEKRFEILERNSTGSSRIGISILPP
jgi:hypothetical protein